MIVGYWLLVIFFSYCWLLVASYCFPYFWSLIASYFFLHWWLFVASYFFLLLVIDCYLFISYCWLFCCRDVVHKTHDVTTAHCTM